MEACARFATLVTSTVHGALIVQLYLASSSPRRQVLLEQIGVEFQTITGLKVDETPLPLENGREYVLRLAKEKAEAGWRYIDQPNTAVVLGADTIVMYEGTLLGKPVSRAQALANLLRLSGKTHMVLTAVALCGAQGTQVQAIATEVTMRELTREHVEKYVATGEPFDKAGGYGIQGYGAALVSTIRGCYSNVVGLPLAHTAQMLESEGVALWQSNS